MNIIILQGPNLNLLGVLSEKTGSRITLDKLNSGLRRHNRNSGSDLKFLQTHKAFQAINFLQRNRNWADGILFAPMGWAHYEYAIWETITILKPPVIQLLLSKDYGSISDPESSIFSEVCAATIIGDPASLFIKGYDKLLTLV